MEGNVSGKHYRLLRFAYNYTRKMYYGTGPKGLPRFAVVGLTINAYRSLYAHRETEQTCTDRVLNAVGLLLTDVNLPDSTFDR